MLFVVAYLQMKKCRVVGIDINSERRSKERESVTDCFGYLGKWEIWLNVNVGTNSSFLLAQMSIPQRGRKKDERNHRKKGL